MKIVIDIPKEHYENLVKIANDGKEPLGYWERVVMRGTPLQKGHGRLIDADDIDNHIIGHVDTRCCPTIIPADKEDGE